MLIGTRVLMWCIGRYRSGISFVKLFLGRRWNLLKSISIVSWADV